MGIQFNQKVTGAIGFTHNVTIPIDTLTVQTTMYNINVNLMAGKEAIQKPRGNILTDPLAITISRMREVRH